jgi:hypothetical protein
MRNSLGTFELYFEELPKERPQRALKKYVKRRKPHEITK